MNSGGNDSHMWGSLSNIRYKMAFSTMERTLSLDLYYHDFDSICMIENAQIMNWTCISMAH